MSASSRAQWAAAVCSPGFSLVAGRPVAHSSNSPVKGGASNLDQRQGRQRRDLLVAKAPGDVYVAYGTTALVELSTPTEPG